VGGQGGGGGGALFFSFVETRKWGNFVFWRGGGGRQGYKIVFNCWFWGHGPGGTGGRGVGRFSIIGGGKGEVQNPNNASGEIFKTPPGGGGDQIFFINFFQT